MKEKVIGVGRKHVLIVDDDPEISRILNEAFQIELPCDITSVSTAAAAVEALSRTRFDLILLDLTLPDMSGIDVCKKARSEGITSPIICLTSRADVVDKIVGLETGADDYITKPFSPREVIARIKAVWRRGALEGAARADASGDSMQFGSLRIDVRTRRVFVGDQPIELSSTEFEILLFLASSPGKVFPREELLSEVLGYELNEYDQSITAHVSRIRSKIEPNPNRPTFIRTIRGVGYRFATIDELTSNARERGDA